jgi:hypothetical protein
LKNAEVYLQDGQRKAPEDLMTQISKLVVGLCSGEYSQKKVARKVIVDGEEIKDDEDKEEYY